MKIINCSPLHLPLPKQSGVIVWEWFFAHLSLSLGEPKNFIIISDRQKWLIPIVRAMMPSAKHCFCCYHIAENIEVAFNDQLHYKKVLERSEGILTL